MTTKPNPLSVRLARDCALVGIFVTILVLLVQSSTDILRERRAYQKRKADLIRMVDPLLLEFAKTGERTTLGKIERSVKAEQAVQSYSVQCRWTYQADFRRTQPTPFGQRILGGNETAERQIQDGDESLGRALIELAPATGFRAFARRSLAGLFRSLLFVWLAAGCIFFYLQYRLLRPLAEYARRAGKANPSAPMVSKVTTPAAFEGTELEVFGSSINRVLRHCEESGAYVNAAQSKVADRDAFIYGVVNNLPISVLTVNEVGQVDTCNPASVAFFGYPPDHLIGMAADRLFADPTRSRFVQALNRFRTSKDARALDAIPREGLAQLQSGGTRRVSMDINEMRTSERRSVVIFIHDRSEHEASEAMLQRMQGQILESQRMTDVGKLISGVSHEFNNVLAGILGNADLALADLPANSPIRNRVADVRTAALGGSELVTQMLSFAGNADTNFVPLSLNEFLRELTPLLKTSIRPGVQLKFHLADGLPAIEANAGMLRQLLVNLVSNANEAIGDEGGAITLRTEVVRTDPHYMTGMDVNPKLKAGYFVCLEIADTGHGISPDDRAKLFTPFFTTREHARGLGLSAVQGILQVHEAALRLESQQGHGSQFTIYFPYCKEQPVTAAPEVSSGDVPANWRGNGTMLIVDDDMAVRKVTGLMLNKRGFKILTANNGEAGVQTYREHRDEIVGVILDLVMPKMNGEQALEEMRRINPDVRVVLCSGFSEQEAPELARLRGSIAFVQKPFEMNDLLDTVYKTIHATDSIS